MTLMSKLDCLALDVGANHPGTLWLIYRFSFPKQYCSSAQKPDPRVNEGSEAPSAPAMSGLFFHSAGWANLLRT